MPQPHFQLPAIYRTLALTDFPCAKQVPSDQRICSPWLKICTFAQLRLQAMASNAVEIENQVAAVEVPFHIHEVSKYCN